MGAPEDVQLVQFSPPAPDLDGLVWNSARSTGAVAGAVNTFYVWDGSSTSPTLTFPSGPAQNVLLGVKEVLNSAVNPIGITGGGDSDIELPDGSHLSGTQTIGGASLCIVWKHNVNEGLWQIVQVSAVGTITVT